MYIIDTINESTELSAKITEIISCSDSINIKCKRLKQLSRNGRSPLANAKAEYYIKVLRRQQCEILQRIVLGSFATAYFIFNLLRIWWYYYPEKNSLPETHFELIDLIKYIYLLPIIAAIDYGIKKLLIREIKK